MSEAIRDGSLFVTGPLSDPYQGSCQYDSAYIREREATKAFWEAAFTGANLTEEQRQTLREKVVQFREAVAWVKKNRTIIPPNVIGTFQVEAKELLESLGYAVTLDPGFMSS